MFEDEDIKTLLLPSNHKVGYFDYGKGKPLVFIHGFPDTAKTFKHQADDFINAGYRVICPYLPGYEYTSPPDNGHFARVDIAGILDEFIGKLCSEQDVVICGHDWGSLLLREIQKQHFKNKNNGEKNSYNLIGLIFSAVPISQNSLDFGKRKMFPGFKQIWASRYSIYFQFPKSIKKIKSKNCDYIRMLWQYWSPGTKSDDEQLLDTMNLLNKNNNLANAVHYYRYMLNPKYQKKIPKQVKLFNQQGNFKENIPALTIRGENDGCLVNLKLYENCTDFFEHPESKYVQIPNAGHFLHYDNPTEFNKQMMTFLKAIHY